MPMEIRMWTDEGIGSCTRCNTERLLFSADGAAALCSVCTLADDRTARAKVLRSLPDPDPVERPARGARPLDALGERQRERRRLLTEKGLCNMCGMEPMRPGKKVGEICTNKYFGRPAKAKAKPRRNRVAMPSYLKDRRARRFKAGLCHDCPCPRMPDSTRCAVCAETNRQNALRRLERKRKEAA